MYDVFLSGPISGVAKFKETFAVAQMEVKRKYGTGIRVWNPALLPEDMSYAWYMRQCVHAVFESKRVVLLKGWENSKGARAERALAEALGIEVVEL